MTRTYLVLPVLLLGLLGVWGAGGLKAKASPAQNTSPGQIVYLPILSKQDATIIINHTTTDLSQVPAEYIQKAKELLYLSYGHTSHGSQLVSGAQYIESVDNLYSFNTNGAIEPGILSLADYTPSGDLGNPDLFTWASRTRDYLNGGGSNRNAVLWSWCGQVSGQTEAQMADNYLTLMPQLEAEFPDVTFIYMTGHLDGSGPTGNLYQRNNQIREYVRQNHKVLFDFADIESYDPDGIYYPNANDSCPWCQAYCDQHPGYCPTPAISCAHSHSLNCYLKGQAFWWMMARLAGWEGPQP